MPFAKTQADGHQRALAPALLGYCEALQKHVRAEETVAMPLAREILTAQDWVEIDACFLDNNDPLFGPQAQARFRELYHRVVSVAPEPVGLGARQVGVLQAAPVASKPQVLLKVAELQSCYGRIQALKGLNLEIRQGDRA